MNIGLKKRIFINLTLFASMLMCLFAIIILTNHRHAISILTHQKADIASKMLVKAYVDIIIMALTIIITTVAFGMMILKRVIKPISSLNLATKEILGGDFNLRIHIDTKDEIEELGDSLNILAEGFKKSKEKPDKG